MNGPGDSRMVLDWTDLPANFVWNAQSMSWLSEYKAKQGEGFDKTALGQALDAYTLRGRVEPSPGCYQNQSIRQIVLQEASALIKEGLDKQVSAERTREYRGHSQEERAATTTGLSAEERLESLQAVEDAHSSAQVRLGGK